MLSQLSFRNIEQTGRQVMTHAALIHGENGDYKLA